MSRNVSCVAPYIAVAMLTSAACHLNAAEPAYPTRPLRIVVPAAPGGGTDIVARLTGQGLSEAWRQSVVIDNRGGAGGIPAVTSVAKGAAPDGYTLLLGSSGHLSFGPAVYRDLPYNPMRDLAPVTVAALQPFIIAVPMSLPANSIRELIALAKAKPDTLRYATGGPGSATHLGTELFRSMSAITLVHVPYKGSAVGVTAAMTGEVQVVMAGISTVLPLVRAKTDKIRALAVTGAQRSAVAPELPTVAESGVPGYEFVVWYGLVAPAGTPRPIVQKINGEVIRVLASPTLQEKYAAGGMEVASSTPAAFGDRMAKEIDIWKKVVRESDIRVE